MGFSKHFFEQFKKDIEEEKKKYKTKYEENEVSFKKCPHKDVKFKNGELRCKCGAAWTGAGIDRLFNLLTNKKI